MRWLINLKIATKLALGFAMVLVLLVVMAGFGSMAILNANHMTDRITHHQIPALTACLEVPEAVRTVQRDLRDGLLLRDRTGVATWSASYNAADRKLTDLTKSYATLAVTAEERENAAALQDSAAAWLPIRDRVADLAKAKRYEEAQKLLYGPEYEQARETVETTAQKALDYQRSTTDRAALTTIAQGRNALTSMLGYAVVAILMGVFAGVFLTRLITRPLAQLSERMEHLRDGCVSHLGSAVKALAEGDLTVSVAATTEPLAIHSKDELGQMAATFNSMLSETQTTIHEFTQAQIALRDLIGSVAESAEAVTAMSAQLTSSAEQTQAASNNIAQSIQQVASAADQSAKTSQEIAQGSEQSAHSATEAAGAMEDLQAAVAQVKEGASDSSRQLRKSAKECRRQPRR